jgi:hypothetical protein
MAMVIPFIHPDNDIAAANAVRAVQPLLQELYNAAIREGRTPNAQLLAEALIDSMHNPDVDNIMRDLACESVRKIACELFGLPDIPPPYVPEMNRQATTLIEQMMAGAIRRHPEKV